jgi:hypothetical protein
MRPKFEQQDTRKKAPKGREDIHEARWQMRGDRSTTDEDVKTDVPMSEIYKNKPLFEQYKKVGFHEHGEAFLRMIEKWEKDEDLTEADRDMREDVRGETVTRLGIVRSCEKLLTKDVFKGLGDANAGINRLVGELGEEWAISLIKPRLVNLVGDENGTESLTELWQALRDMNGVYRENGFNKVYSRIEKRRAEYGITPAKWAEIQAGGNFMETSQRAYQEFQKQHGFFGRVWNKIPHMWHAGKIGFAGWREEQDGAMQRLRETRARAVDVLGLIMGPDFQKVIDQAIKTGNQPDTEKMLKEQEEKDAETARGLTVDQIKTRHDTQWMAYSTANPGENNTAGYDNWLENSFKSDYKTEAQGQGGGWIARLMTALFGIRLEQVPRPAGI